MELKERLISELRKLKIPGLLSCSIIGSSVTNEKLSNVEDIDLYFIIREIDAEIYRLIADQIKGVCRDLSTKDIVFSPEFRGGAFKPSYKKGLKQIQLHINISTPETIPRKSPMLSLDWRLNNKLISGKKVSDFLKVDKFSKDELVDGRDGLKYFLGLLKSDKIAYREWVVTNNKIERIQKEQRLESKEDWFGLIQFVVIQGFVNFIRLNEPTFQKNELSMLEKSKTLPPDHSKFIKEVIGMKKRLKQSGNLDFDLARTKGKASSFIEYLIEQAS